jgi:ATP-dependent helicase HrpB
LEHLPIDDILPQVTENLAKSRALVLKAAPGAGKTTRVPPAILDAGLAVLADKKPGQIVVLQPRRVAARAAAARIADERGTALGAEIGYRVRHEGRSSKETRILVCTTGVFLRRLQDDPGIEDVAVVIFDEFHERSVDSDLALALTRQVQQEIRPDLNIVVMSATLDGAPIAAYLNGCPSLECPGRTYPIDIDYMSHATNARIDDLVVEGLKRMLDKNNGDVLVFLPGVGEIRQVQNALENIAASEKLALMPLYGDMALGDQQAVLLPSKNRKIVLATNVAETSLTIDGVTVVIDSGLARINRFDPTLSINRLDLSRISKASATQRAGRAGRTAPGACLRLWSEREQSQMDEYELPEIERVELSECMLQLLAWGEHDFDAFPWFEKPPAAVIERALELLERLGATEGGKLTAIGKAMSKLPLQPRLARLMIEGAQLGQLRRAAICAALLSERPPFKNEERGGLKDHHSANYQRTHHTDSDVLEQVRAIENFEDNGERRSIMGELLPGPTKQILRVSDQLSRLMDGDKKSSSAPAQSKSKDTVTADDALLRAIMTAFPDRICKRRKAKDPRAVMVGGRGIKLAEQSTVFDAPMFVAVDMVDLNKPELAVRRASAVELSWLPQNLISTSVDVSYDKTRQKIVALKRTRFCDLILDESIASIPPDVDVSAALAQAVAENFDLETLVDDRAKEYLARVQCLREWLPELELPDLGTSPWETFLTSWCAGCTSVAELRERSLVDAINANLTYEQTTALTKEAPEQFKLTGGRFAKLQYEPGKPPILPARIQELFGFSQTPSIARSRVPLMLHILAPNYRVQQITHDLAGFWKNTYPDLKKELKGRYPKHKWPDDPLQK